MSRSHSSGEFSHRVDVGALPPGGLSGHVEANASECGLLAKRFGIPAVRTLEADFTVMPWRGSGARVRGSFHAGIVQTCVVSLDEFESEVSDQFELTFLPEEAASAPEAREIVIDVEAEEPPETFSNGQIDIGEIVAEHLALSLDPYPRKPGAVLDQARYGPSTEEEPDRTSPFAALQSLRPKSSEGETES